MSGFGNKGPFEGKLSLIKKKEKPADQKNDEKKKTSNS